MLADPMFGFGCHNEAIIDCLGNVIWMKLCMYGIWTIRPYGQVTFDLGISRMKNSQVEDIIHEVMQ